jgi:D-alanine-D-alanine ligase
MEKIRVGVIFGGRSGEHEVAVRSATTVINQINRDKYEAIPIAITKEGHWLNPVESLGLLPQETQQLLLKNVGSFPRNAVGILGDTKYKGLTMLEAAVGEERTSRLDVVFPVLHGTFGEDGTIRVCLRWQEFRM